MLEICIKSENSEALWYEIKSGSAECVLRSRNFKTICQIETALAGLWEIARYPEAASIVQSSAKTEIVSLLSRRRVSLSDQVCTADLKSVLHGIPQAKVLDERPNDRRRTDLTGPLRKLIH